MCDSCADLDHQRVVFRALTRRLLVQLETMLGDVRDSTAPDNQMYPEVANERARYAIASIHKFREDHDLNR